MTARHLTNPNGYVTQINDPLHFRPWPGKKGEAAMHEEVLTEPASVKVYQKISGNGEFPA
jgi:hypothetical protein